jgi:hypothetical protein
MGSTAQSNSKWLRFPATPDTIAPKMQHLARSAIQLLAPRTVKGTNGFPIDKPGMFRRYF